MFLIVIVTGNCSFFGTGMGRTVFLQKRGGVTQGGALSMVAYGICILLMIKNVKAKFPDVTQHWYADYVSVLDMFANVKLYFNYIKRFGPGRGYYPKPSKSVLIMHPENIEVGKRFGLCH